VDTIPVTQPTVRALKVTVVNVKFCIWTGYRTIKMGSVFFLLWNHQDGSAILWLRNHQFPCFFLLCPQKTSPFFYTYPTKTLF